MKPATRLRALQGIVALTHAAVLSAPNPLAVAATLRALAAEAQRLAGKIERSDNISPIHSLSTSISGLGTNNDALPTERSSS